MNTDGRKHSVWAQERLGWTELAVRTVITYVGRDCPANFDGSQHVRADFPGPSNKDWREFRAGCNSPDNDKGPICNFDASHL